MTIQYFAILAYFESIIHSSKFMKKICIRNLSFLIRLPENFKKIRKLMTRSIVYITGDVV